MRTYRPRVPMVEPEDFVKRIYECDEQEFSFAQLCCHFGLKYMNVWWKVRYNGMTVEEAIKTCMADPHSWGATYSNGSLAIMNEAERKAKAEQRNANWQKTMREKGYHKNGERSQVDKDND